MKFVIKVSKYLDKYVFKILNISKIVYVSLVDICFMRNYFFF